MRPARRTVAVDAERGHLRLGHEFRLEQWGMMCLEQVLVGQQELQAGRVELALNCRLN